MKVNVDEVTAAADVVDAADRRSVTIGSVCQPAGRALLSNGWDSLIAQVSVQELFPCGGQNITAHSESAGNTILS